MRDRMEAGVEKRLFVVHLWTLCQKLLMPRSAKEFGVKRSAPGDTVALEGPHACPWGG